VPGRAARQLFTLDENDVAPAHFAQVVGDGAADDAAAHDDDPRTSGQIYGHPSPHPQIFGVVGRVREHRGFAPSLCTSTSNMLPGVANCGFDAGK